MSYIRYPLGADTAPDQAPPAPGPGYVWVPPAGGKAGYWRRAMRGEVGTSGEGAVVQRVHVGGQVEIRKWDGTKWVTVETKQEIVRPGKSGISNAAICAQLPKETAARCAELGAKVYCRPGAHPQTPEICERLDFGVIWQQCAASGIPASKVPECLMLAAEAGSRRPGSAVAQIQQQLARRKLLLYSGIALGVVGIVYYLRKREQA
jgi:hypothetical protein